MTRLTPAAFAARMATFWSIINHGTTVLMKMSTPARASVSFSIESPRWPVRISTPDWRNVWTTGLEMDSGRTSVATRCMREKNQRILVAHTVDARTNFSEARSPLTMLWPVRPVAPRISTRGRSLDMASGAVEKARIDVWLNC